MLSLAKSRCTTSINLKICNFNDNPYTIIPLSVCDKLCSTSVYGSDHIDQSRTSMARSDHTCPLCQEEEETALHLLGRCSALSTTRFTLLGLYRMDYTELGNIRWPLLLKLAKAARRFL